MQALTHSACSAAGPQRPSRKQAASCARLTCSGTFNAPAVQSSRRHRRRLYAAAAPELEEGALEPSTSYGATAEDDEQDAESRALALAMAKVAWETKGEDILVLNVSPLVYWTRYMVMVTVFSRPQLNAMLVKMEQEAAAQFGRELAQNQQVGRSTWELLDYGDVVVNVMTDQQRQYYDLESFYGAAEEVELPFAVEGEGGSVDWKTKL